MRLGCIAILAGLYLVWSGGQGLYTAAKNREPLRVSCQEFSASRASQEWLELERCSLSLMEASYFESGGKVTELFLPARGGEEENEEAAVQVLVATKDEELLALANQLLQIEDESSIMRFAVENHARLFPTRDVRGLVRFGVDLDDSERDQLKSLDAALADDFVIIDEGREPGFGRPLGFLAGGALLVLIPGVGLLGLSSSKS